MVFDPSHKLINRGNIKKYLRKFFTWAYQQKVDNDQTFEFDAYNMPYCHVKCTQELNRTDCGLFLLKYAKYSFI